jgi:hypothetical protein
LDQFSIISKYFDPADERHLAIIGRIKTATMGTLQNLPKVAGSL